MNEGDEESEYEPIEKVCKICGYGEDIEHMTNCPRCAEDLDEKGIAPGWIHKSCCEDQFTDDVEGCIECCDDDEVFENIKKHFDKCVDLEGLAEKAVRGVPVFLSNDNIIGITPQMDKFLEPIKPLNVVTSIFQDKENGIVYSKDNQNNVNMYSLPLFEDIQRRFSSFWPYHPEKFCIKDGPLFLVYDFGDTSIGAMIAPRIKTDEFEKADVGLEVATKYKERYLEAEAFFGVAVKPSREDLKSAIQKLSEDQLITVVLCPLLNSLGFKGVKSISFHGPGESGGDFHPFYKTNEFGKIVYYSAQAKACKIHSKAGVKEGNINQLIDQVKKLFRTPFKSFIDNTQKRISFAFVFCSQDITPEARDQLFHEVENRQTVSLVDVDDLTNFALEMNLGDEITGYLAKKEKGTET
jgi:hypothetical protein